MRKYAFPQNNPSHEIQKVMIHETAENGIYVYVYKTKQDTPSHNDFWFDDLQDAEKFCKEYFKTKNSDWVYTAEPIDECLHDVIRPIRRKEKPFTDRFQILEDGVWKDIEF